jgi:hypothetical protein
MPALAVTQPNYPTWLDLHDADSPVDRQLASANAALASVLSLLMAIQKDPLTGATRAGGTYPRPLHISATEVGTYEGDIDAMLAAGTGLQHLISTHLRHASTL